jgi:hypothetical protein
MSLEAVRSLLSAPDRFTLQEFRTLTSHNYMLLFLTALVASGRAHGVPEAVLLHVHGAAVGRFKRAEFAAMESRLETLLSAELPPPPVLPSPPAGASSDTPATCDSVTPTATPQQPLPRPAARQEDDSHFEPRSNEAVSLIPLRTSECLPPSCKAVESSTCAPHALHPVSTWGASGGASATDAESQSTETQHVRAKDSSTHDASSKDGALARTGFNKNVLLSGQESGSETRGANCSRQSNSSAEKSRGMSGPSGNWDGSEANSCSRQGGHTLVPQSGGPLTAEQVVVAAAASRTASIHQGTSAPVEQEAHVLHGQLTQKSRGRPYRRPPSGGRAPFLRPPEADLVVATTPLAFASCVLSFLQDGIVSSISHYVIEALYIAMLVRARAGLLRI